MHDRQDYVRAYLLEASIDVLKSVRNRFASKGQGASCRSDHDHQALSAPEQPPVVDVSYNRRSMPSLVLNPLPWKHFLLQNLLGITDTSFHRKTSSGTSVPDEIERHFTMLNDETTVNIGLSVFENPACHSKCARECRGLRSRRVRRRRPKWGCRREYMGLWPS